MAKSNSKQKKMNVRVDFTPMVDMNMLLITFFMLCTSLIKPQSMDINMPSNKKDLNQEQQNKVKESEAYTLLLDGNDKIYYYQGMADVNNMKETNYSKTGLRAILLQRNMAVVQAVEKLKAQKGATAHSANASVEAGKDSLYKKKLENIKVGKLGGTSEERASVTVPTVIIKATDKASYKNLIDALDEMQICSIGKYVIDKITPEDLQMIEAFKAKGGK